MASPAGERALNDALGIGRALLKFISANDAGMTGSHQYGFYLPLAVWKMFTPQPPTDGVNHKHFVDILWQSGLTTKSAVTWYGKGTRHEYRLTRFGRDFPFLNDDAVGNLLVLVPEDAAHFRGYVLDLEEDIDDVQVALGVEVVETWGVYEAGVFHGETEDNCIERRFRGFAAEVEAFPTGHEFSEAARNALVECIHGFPSQRPDRRLLRAIDAEYQLFKLVERRLCEPDICRVFESVDDFLKTAATIMNRRKSRAGRSFENHVESILREEGIPFDMRPAVDGKPDLVIPSRQAYEDASYPVENLFVVGLKTTCKDRWRQVTREGQRVPTKHLLTMQRGISTAQLTEMQDANVRLVVPEGIQATYPPERPMELLTLDGFINAVRERIR